MDPDFTFRYRLTLAQRSGITAPEASILLYSAPGGQQVYLASSDMTAPLQSTKDVVLRSSGWPSEPEATAQGLWFGDRLRIAFARHRVGVHPEQCVARSGFFAPGLKMLEAQTGHRMLNDTYGLSVFATEPPPRFARAETTFSIQPSTEALVTTMADLFAMEFALTSRDSLALDLLNTSYLQPNAATRLLTLIIAVESLIQPLQRAGAPLVLVESFLRQTTEATNLAERERESLLGSLRYLRLQSIGSAGRALARERLGDRQYMEKPADRFFTHCYELRSRLVHGTEPQPSDEELGGACGGLELFVSDLITHPFLPL